MPHVVGVRLTGALPRGSTATDLVLVVTELLRAHGVVGAFVEFAGDGLASLSLADRATISNMSPEFGATATLFPIDDETLAYLRLTGRSAERVDLVERTRRSRACGAARRRARRSTRRSCWTCVGGAVGGRAAPAAGPRAAQDLRDNFRPTSRAASRRWPLEGRRRGVVEGAPSRSRPRPTSFAPAERRRPAADRVAGAHRIDALSPDRGHVGGETVTIRTGSVAIAAITSCTNTSNPTVMIGAGLLARNAVARGLRVGPTVKTSLAPGSRAVTGYLEAAGLMAPLEALGFALAGYGCTTCIGNSGPLDEAVAGAVEANDLVVAAVLSGNRNFEGRIHPLARASYLASPPLVVAFALAGRVDIDLTTEPLGFGDDGQPVFLADIWPSPEEIRAVIGDSIDPELFRATYATVFDGDDRWRALPIPSGDRYAWDPTLDLHRQAAVLRWPVGSSGAGPRHRRTRASWPSSATRSRPTTSPRPGRSRRRRPAGQWLQERGVDAARVQLLRRPARPPRGDDARHVRQHPPAQRAGRGPGRPVHRPPARRRGRVHLRRRDALRARGRAARHPRRPRVRLGLVAGLGGQGHRRCSASGRSSPRSYERIHRSNLVGMGVLPLQYQPGDSAASLGLTGREAFSILGLEAGLTPRQRSAVIAPRRRRRRAAVQGDRPARRPDRRRVLPRRRDPAGRPASAGGRGFGPARPPRDDRLDAQTPNRESWRAGGAGEGGAEHRSERTSGA